SRYLAAYILCMLLALYTHYYAIFLAVFVNLFVLAQIFSDQHGAEGLHGRPSNPLSLPRWIGAQAIVAALYLPWLAYAFRISVDYSRPAVNLRDMVDVVGQALAEYSLGTSMPDAVAFPLS